MAKPGTRTTKGVAIARRRMCGHRLWNQRDQCHCHGAKKADAHCRVGASTYVLGRWLICRILQSHIYEICKT